MGLGSDRYRREVPEPPRAGALALWFSSRFTRLSNSRIQCSRSEIRLRREIARVLDVSSRFV